MTVTHVILKGPVGYIANWLRDFTEHTCCERPSFPTERGRIVLGQFPSFSAFPEGYGIGFRDLEIPLDADGFRLFQIEITGYLVPPDKYKPTKEDSIGDVVTFMILPIDPERVEVAAKCNHPAVKSFVEETLREMKKRWPEAQAKPTIAVNATEKQRQGGRPGLRHNERIYRLAKAQEAEQIRHDDPSMTWKEIAKEIQWRYGIGERGLALLRDARHRLHRLEKNDPEALLQELTQWSEAKETNKT